MSLLSEIEGRESPYSSLLDFFGNNHQIALATLIQNLLHPKNSMRVEAIKAESYVEIDCEATARDFLTELLKKSLEIELKSAESEVNAQIKKLQ